MRLRVLLASLIVCLSGSLQAELHDRGSGMVYDDVLDITWLQDANYALTSGFDNDANADGQLSWSEAVGWADNLVYNGFDNWRLPSTRALNPSDPCFAYDGSCDTGFNITHSELGYMFYVNLGNQGRFDEEGTERTSGYGLLNTSFANGGDINDQVSFMNLYNNIYHIGELFPAPPGSDTWAFYMDRGGQNRSGHSGGTAVHYAWPVADGDVGYNPDGDYDGDSITNEADNCRLIANFNQRDTDGDGHGNVCDFDYTNDCVTNFFDLIQLSVAFGVTTGDPSFNEHVDLDGNGVINFLDFGAPPNNFSAFFTNAPGPSATVCVPAR